MLQFHPVHHCASQQFSSARPVGFAELACSAHTHWQTKTTQEFHEFTASTSWLSLVAKYSRH
mgnify:CR=1 FL=1